ncbi:hypothetical protein [Sporosarcina sp. A2]|uniref:hypothetical protein n=1 Tax=Sporosarcina sp. A2 TaxID=3393449 RepID=UPI003D7BBEAC
MLIYLLFIAFLFVFIESGNTLKIVAISILLLALLFVFYKGKFDFYFKLFPFMGLIFLPIIISINNHLIQELGTEQVTPSNKMNMLSSAVAEKINATYSILTYQNHEVGNLNIIYPSILHKEAADLITLQPYLSSLNNYFPGSMQSDSITVTLYDEKLFMYNKFNARNAIARFKNGEIQLFYNDENSTLIREALVHEYIHALFNDYKKTLNAQHIPVWVEEGLAEYSRCEFVEEEGEICFEDEDNLKSDIPLENLQTINDWSHIYDISSAYYTSYHKVRELVEVYGADFLQEINK